MKNHTWAKQLLVFFAAVLAALLVYSAPGWWRKRQAERESEQEQAFELRLMDLTPRQLIARCGKPEKDVEDTKDGYPFTRSMTYNGTNGIIELDFFGYGDKTGIRWSFSGYFGEIGKFGSFVWADTLSGQLPCAARKAPDELNDE